MSKLIPTDRTGQVSRTLLMVLIGAGAIVYKFLTNDGIALTEFAMAYSAVMMVWVGRETKEAYFKGKENA